MLSNAISKISSISVIAVALYYSSKDYGFVFDDLEAIVNNDDVTFIHPNDSFIKLFCHDFWGSEISSKISHKSYRPLTVMSFRLNRFMQNDLEPSSFHVVNVVLYGCVCCLLYIVYNSIINELKYKMSCGTNLSLMSAFIFVCHPLHTENVSAIVGRADLLCALFYLFGFLLYIRFEKLKDIQLNFTFKSYISLLLFILCVICSFLSKEQGITLLGICFMYSLIIENEFCFKFKFFKSGSSKHFSFKEVPAKFFFLIIFCLVLLYARLKIMNFESPHFQIHDNPQSFLEPFHLRIMNYHYLYALNAWLLIYPHWLCFDWSMGCVPLIESLMDWRMTVILLFYLTAIIFFYKCYVGELTAEKKLLMLSLVWIILPFIPSSNIFFKVGFVIAERNLFLSTIGSSLLISLVFHKLVNHFKSTKYFEKVILGCLAILLLCYSMKTTQRNTEWKDEETLFTSGLKVCPLNAKVHYNVAKIAYDGGNVTTALFHYEEALRLNPLYDQAMNNLGNLYKEQGNLLKAEQLLHKALEIRKDFATGWMNLANVKASLKKFREAEIFYKQALMYKKNYSDCYYNLGNLYLELNKSEEALFAWKNATKLNNHHISAWVNMLILLDNKGLLNDMKTIYKEARHFNPNESLIHFHFASALGKAGFFEESEKYFKLAIKFDEHSALYHSNLGVLYHRFKRYEEARRHYNVALTYDPKNELIMKNYNLLKKLL